MLQIMHLIFKAAVLSKLGKIKEALQFCEKWIQEEPENVVAATAGVYAYIDKKEYDKAETLVDRFITDKSKCFEKKTHGSMNVAL